MLVGDTSDSYNWADVPLFDMHTSSLGLGGLDISTQEGAAEAFSNIHDIINHISDVRGEYGAIQNRLEHTINNLGAMKINSQDSESAIRDTDMAKEILEKTKNSVISQTAEIMMSQANINPQQVLSLIQS